MDILISREPKILMVQNGVVRLKLNVYQSSESTDFFLFLLQSSQIISLSFVARKKDPLI